MLDFYRTPAGERLVDETLPEIAEQLGRIADLFLLLVNERLELDEEDEKIMGVCLPGDSPLNGIPCRVAHVESDAWFVELDPETVEERFPDLGSRREVFQDPWGSSLWFQPGKYYFKLSEKHVGLV